MTVVIAAGGTGGHLYPAVALAREFLRQDPKTTVLFVGTSRELERKVLTHEGFELEKILAWPVMGLGMLRAAAALLALPVGLYQSLRILRTRQADLVIGVGGYSSPPVLVAASLLGIRRVILEPNAYPGMANRVLGPLADIIFVAFEAAGRHFTPSKVRVVGTPIRRAFLEPAQAVSPGLPEVAARAAGGANRTLLIFGGSQGAHAINAAMLAALPHLDALRASVSVIHQTGEADHDVVKAAYEAAGFRSEVVPFVFDMPRALRSADLVVSRSGAVTVAELTACGKAAVLIPLPHAIYRHQERNAQVMESGGAAVVLSQENLTGLELAQTIETLLRDPGRLRAMGALSRVLGRVDSAERMVRECQALVARKAKGEGAQPRAC
ncbi:MAG: undecaprenyldiphospho-muramoylpentapeptide beta-N-acetylglucosaminyltransferase [Nitrospirae bacterium]|nr:MAG: undecaprenyldiphospho-muramoylpentapeptide beta-N-acetylglucosaminyltransferase [Nitrospirota bacterium]